MASKDEDLANDVSLICFYSKTFFDAFCRIIFNRDSLLSSYGCSVKYAVQCNVNGPLTLKDQNVATCLDAVAMSGFEPFVAAAV